MCQINLLPTVLHVITLRIRHDLKEGNAEFLAEGELQTEMHCGLNWWNQCKKNECNRTCTGREREWFVLVQGTGEISWVCRMRVNQDADIPWCRRRTEGRTQEKGLRLSIDLEHKRLIGLSWGHVLKTLWQTDLRPGIRSVNLLFTCLLQRSVSFTCLLWRFVCPCYGLLLWPVKSQTWRRRTKMGPLNGKQMRILMLWKEKGKIGIEK